jgi:type II secretory pathway predicted ATPase ExeA
MLLEKLPEQVETVYLANPSLSRDEILYAIAEELHAPLPEGRVHLLLRTLQERLLEIYAAGRQVVVLIDEAHAMPPETLEEIRLLSNLESNRHKLLQIVLFGQTELDDRLSETSMRQLKERITHNFALEPLHRKDIAGYLMFRMRAAGYHGPDLFTQSAIQLISQASEGLTRRINILADKALLSAFSESSHQIDSKQIKAAIRDAQFKPMHDGKAKPWAWISAAAAITAVAGLAYMAGARTSTVEEPARPIQAAVPANPAPALPPTAPTTPPATPAPLVMPAEPAAPVAPIPADPAPTAAPVVTNTVLLGKKPRTLTERITATSEWLKTTPDTHYFIQLLNTDATSQRQVELFVDNTEKLLDPQQIRVYRSNLSGRDKLGVIYGDFASREAANAALAKLPDPIRTSRPYIRATSKLH